MGDDKKKPGGKKGGAVGKALLLVILLLVGAEVAARVTSQYEWSPVVRIGRFIKSQR